MVIIAFHKSSGYNRVQTENIPIVNGIGQLGATISMAV
jgi:hypothetical protein